MQKRILFCCLLFLPIAFSCNKIIEKKKESVAMDAITNGRWYVKDYKAAGVYVSAEFDGYEFQFYNDGKVEAIVNTSVTNNGTWVGDMNAETITSSFAGASQPISRLNGVWKLTDNSWTYVKAYNVNGVDTNFLDLRKK